MCRAVRPSSDGRSSCGPRSSSIVSIRQLAHATPPGSKSPCAAPRRFVASANCFRSRWPSAARGARGSCRPTSRASRRVGGPLTSSRSAEAAFAPPPCQLRRESVTSFAWASARSPARPPVRRLWGRGSQPARRPILRIAETQARGEENGTGRTVSQRRSGVSFSSSCSLRVSRAREYQVAPNLATDCRVVEPAHHCERRAAIGGRRGLVGSPPRRVPATTPLSARATAVVTRHAPPRCKIVLITASLGADARGVRADRRPGRADGIGVSTRRPVPPRRTA
jgi:hypothetical protein